MKIGHRNMLYDGRSRFGFISTCRGSTFCDSHIMSFSNGYTQGSIHSRSSVSSLQGDSSSRIFNDRLAYWNFRWRQTEGDHNAHIKA